MWMEFLRCSMTCTVAWESSHFSQRSRLSPRGLTLTTVISASRKSCRLCPEPHWPECDETETWIPYKNQITLLKHSWEQIIQRSRMFWRGIASCEASYAYCHPDGTMRCELFLPHLSSFCSLLFLPPNLLLRNPGISHPRLLVGSQLKALVKAFSSIKVVPFPNRNLGHMFR